MPSIGLISLKWAVNLKKKSVRNNFALWTHFSSFRSAHLVPVYSFGEADIYDQYVMAEGSWKRAFQVKFNKIVGVPPIIPKGRGLFNYTLGILPCRRPINTVGKHMALKLNRSLDQAGANLLFYLVD